MYVSIGQHPVIKRCKKTAKFRNIVADTSLEDRSKPDMTPRRCEVGRLWGALDRDRQTDKM